MPLAFKGEKREDGALSEVALGVLGLSILRHVEPLPPDPIFGLGEQVKRDPNPKKVDLTVGVYHDEQLQIKTMEAISQAEETLLKVELHKAYLPIDGLLPFVRASRSFLFGDVFARTEEVRFMGVQAVGGTHALRIGGELLRAHVGNHLYLSDPTWPNHFGLFGACKMEIRSYPYYNEGTHQIEFTKMLDLLAKAPERGIVLLHVCCHNPTGCDLEKEEWKELSALMERRQLIPFFDCAYQGFAKDTTDDVWPVRYFAGRGHELFVAHSFSKFFGLYGERVGALHVLLRDEDAARRGITILKRLIRTDISNPPLHGATLAAMVMEDGLLREKLESELARMRQRIEKMRSKLLKGLQAAFHDDRFHFLGGRRGFFALLGLSSVLTERLREEHSVHLTGGGRINLTGLTEQNLPYVIDAIYNTLK